MTKEERLELIVQLLNAGVRAADIARVLSISRERMRQLIHNQVPWGKLKIRCQFCGEPMDTEWGLQYLYHEACDSVYLTATCLKPSQNLMACGSNERKKPVGQFEEAAIAAYTERGYDITWMPYSAPFDYTVNGIPVDVKGARLDRQGRWQFGMPHWDKHGNDIVLGNRCTIAHFIGKVSGAYQHFILPAETVATRPIVTFYPTPQSYVCTDCAAQFPTHQGLALHRTRWCGHIPNWQEYQDDWWRLEENA